MGRQSKVQAWFAFGVSFMGCSANSSHTGVPPQVTAGASAIVGVAGAVQAGGGVGQSGSGMGQAGARAVQVVVGPAGTGNAGAAGSAQAGSDASSPSFAATVQPFINKACNCHQSNPLMAPFSLRMGEAYGDLVNVPAQQLPSMMRVKPGSMTESYLWYKINGTQAQVGGSGMIMPYTVPLNADEKAIFERWIAAGAPP